MTATFFTHSMGIFQVMVYEKQKKMLHGGMREAQKDKILSEILLCLVAARHKCQAV